jgi:alginate O-acetyltransferase complex protein AlgI
MHPGAGRPRARRARGADSTLIFLTYWFVCFAAVFFPLYGVVRHRTARLVILVAGCLVFHFHFAGWSGVLPMVALAAVTYAAALPGRRLPCIAAIVLCAAGLAVYKYTPFVANDVLGADAPLGRTAAQLATLLPAAVPLGISFFTFEFVHYLSDVMRGARPIRRPLDFAAFAVFWPSLVAGPVKRYQQFVPALHEGLAQASLADSVQGMVRVCVGLVKKWGADNLTAFIAAEGARFAQHGPSMRWAIFIALGLRIWLDFSGYSDIAIGFARMMGITLPENFNWPYLARNLVEFWHRWHISLSLWIRDYIYIALGGNRRGPARRIANGLLAFAICGLWHGPAWHFVIWGLYHGAGLAVVTGYRALRRRGQGGAAGPVAAFWAGADGGALFHARALRRLADLLSWAATMIFVWVGWLLFFYPVDRALVMLGQLLGFA